VSGVRFPAPPPIFSDRTRIYYPLFSLSKDFTFVAIGPYSQESAGMITLIILTSTNGNHCITEHPRVSLQETRPNPLPQSLSRIFHYKPFVDGRLQKYPCVTDFNFMKSWGSIKINKLQCIFARFQNVSDSSHRIYIKINVIEMKNAYDSI
jgi:hypothetical protein